MQIPYKFHYISITILQTTYGIIVTHTEYFNWNVPYAIPINSYDSCIILGSVCRCHKNSSTFLKESYGRHGIIVMHMEHCKWEYSNPGVNSVSHFPSFFITRPCLSKSLIVALGTLCTLHTKASLLNLACQAMCLCYTTPYTCYSCSGKIYCILLKFCVHLHNWQFWIWKLFTSKTGLSTKSSDLLSKQQLWVSKKKKPVSIEISHIYHIIIKPCSAYAWCAVTIKKKKKDMKLFLSTDAEMGTDTNLKLSLPCHTNLLFTETALSQCEAR